MIPSTDQPSVDARQGHPISIIPTESIGSPTEMIHHSFDHNTPFWKPDLADICKHLGWRWVMFLPAMVLAVAMVAIPFYPHFAGLIFLGGGKLLLLAIGFAITTAGTAVKSAIRTRTDPFCIHCGYDLAGLDETHVCPECGRPFNLRLIEEYRRDPQWFVARYRDRKNAPIVETPFAAGPVRRKKSRDGT